VRLLGDWLESNSRKSGSRIILAADVGGPYATRLERASSLISSTKEGIAGVKLHWYLLRPFGVLNLRELVEQCHDAGLPIIVDFKLNDVGSTNLEVVDTLFSNGFDALIANPFVGYKEGMEEVIKRSRELGKGVILLVYMSHKGAREGYGLKVGGEPLYLRFARKTREWGADGAIVSAKSLSIIRRVKSVLGSDQVILSPGVGFQGGEAGKAIKAGADYLIVGRTIINSKDPVKSLDALNRELGPRGP
jgi:orotidine-5'-phosphate decarboxylase